LNKNAYSGTFDVPFFVELHFTEQRMSMPEKVQLRRLGKSNHPITA